MAEKKQEEIYKERFLNRDSRWMHMPGQSTGAYTNATHGMTLSAVALPHYRYIMPYGLKKFKRFAEKVWNVCPDGKKDEQIVKEDLDAMEGWMKKLGVAMNLREIGAMENMKEQYSCL